MVGIKRFKHSEVQAEGKAMGVIVPSSPMASFEDMAYKPVSIYSVNGLIDLISSMEWFTTNPLYIKSHGAFKHFAFTQGKDKEPITKVEDFTYQQMAYLQSVNPASMSSFLLRYKALIVDYDTTNETNEKLKGLLKNVLSEHQDDMDESMKDTIREAIGD